MRKSVVLYHANCTDGFAAAYAAWVALGDDAEYIPVKYGYAPPDVTDKVVYILDFSYTPDEVHALAAKAYHVIMLDHHKTAMDQWSHLLVADESGGMRFHRGGLDVVFDMERSGAQLAWDWFFPSVPRPHIIDHIGDRDLWKFALPGTRAVCAALNSHKKDFQLWDYLAGPTRYVELLTEGGAILRMQERQVADIASGPLRPVEITLYSPDGLARTERGLAANVRENISEVGNAIAEKSGTFALTFFIEGDKAVCSLRSIGDYDVTPIAMNFGGGGHKNAAGFTVFVRQFLAEVWE